MLIQRDQIQASDRALFAACTKISVGCGDKTRFWIDRWIDGVAPATLAPTLFKLASRKNLLVKDALFNGRWMRGLQKISCPNDLELFVMLWHRIQMVQLSGQSDTVVWNLTANKKYLPSSANEA